jgi:hypothetical protein
MANWAYKAYGRTRVFKSRRAIRSHVTKWMAATEGSERDRAVQVLVGIEAGKTYIDTDAKEV